MPVQFKDEYIKMDEEYGDQIYKMWGPTLLSYPMDVDSSRLYMFTSNIRQVLTLLNPDVPRIQTGFENTIGKYNKAYKKIEGKWKVVDKILKFKSGQLYALVLYNEETNTYDIIEKVIAENLTEKFGYLYNNDKLDKLEIGSTIEDEIVYKTTSYDDNMNYMCGKNANVYYSTSNDTLEDAVVIRKSWTEGVKSAEIDVVQVPINDNDVLLNLYGDDISYRTFPNIGDPVINSTVCATRRINKEHLLYDFQSPNMREVCSTDVDYFVSKDSYIYDIDIFYNGDGPFPDNLFYSQLKGYYTDICEYADKMYKWTREIKSSGSNFTKNVTYFKSKYQNFNDHEFKWKNRDKAFNHLVVEFKVKSIVGLEPGSKITGRYGNKGVISRIVDDTANKIPINMMNSLLDMMGKEQTEEERSRLADKIEIVDDDKMPYTDNYLVDIILNSSGAIRRLNLGQLYEVELNFCSETIRRHIITLSSMEEKEDIIFKYLSLVNEDQYKFFYEMYSSYTKIINVNDHFIRFVDNSGKLQFIKDVEENGFYLIKPPHANIRYETLKKIYEIFDFIKPVALYIDIFGTKKRRIIKDGIVGSEYMFILKQNSNKNFSARSTFRVNRANMPAKDSSKKTNRSAYSKSPIRIGEAYNLFSSISGTTLSEFNIFMRSSTIGRKSLQKILETDGNPLAVKKLKIQSNYTNANADVLNAKLKGVGLRIKFLNSKEETPDVIEDIIMPLYINGYTIYDTPLNRPMYNKLFLTFNKYLRENSVVESYIGHKENIAWEYVFKLPEIKELNISDDMKDMLIKATSRRSLEEGTSEIPKSKKKKTLKDEHTDEESLVSIEENICCNTDDTVPIIDDTEEIDEDEES